MSYISQNFVKPNIVMYFSPNLVKNYSHNFFPQNVAQFFFTKFGEKVYTPKIHQKMALKITKFGENLVTKFSFTNFGDILVHFIFTKFGDSLKFSPNLVNIFSIFFSPRTLGLLPRQYQISNSHSEEEKVQHSKDFSSHLQLFSEETAVAEMFGLENAVKITYEMTDLRDNPNYIRSTTMIILI